jgi:gliding motility-associated-like protein
MKKTMLFLAGILWAALALAQYTVRGGTGSPLQAEDNKPSRIQVYLLNGLANAEISFQTQQAEPHQWYKYNTRYSEAIPLACRQEGNTSTVREIEDGWGYFVESPSQPTPSFVWIIDYSRHRPTIASLEVQEEDDKCNFLKLIARVDADPLDYRTYSGAVVSLLRTFHLTYNNLEWNNANHTFNHREENVSLRGAVSEIILDAPLANTAFTLAGDDYSQRFGIAQQITTAEYQAIAVEAHAEMIATTATGETEEAEEAGAQKGYSAPVEIRFQAWANEPVAALYIWTVLKTNPKTGERSPIVRYTERSMTYLFRESGDYTVQLEVIDATSNCSNTTQLFTITIGDSDLKLPNAFSPGASPGINDEYKVAYKSLIRFQASIYNRWGQLLYHWTDPAKGWDGKVNGQYVPTGVYFITVEAQGADGKTYRQTKDINILRTKE